MKKIMGVYKITNIVNNKIYVGSSSDVNRRKSMHLKQLLSNTHFNKYLQHSFNKYGRENFVFDIIEEIIDINNKEQLRKILLEREQYWLNKLNPYDNIGYNILKTAGSNLGKIVSSETKEKLRKLQLGRKRSDETRLKISNAQKSREHKPLTEEHKKKISEANRGKTVSLENRVFYSIINRQYKHTDVAKNKISQSLIGNKRGRGKHLSEKHKNKLIESNITAVINLDTKKIFKSLKEAALFYNIKSRSGISMCCGNKQKTCGGYKWAYLEDYIKEQNK
jgi:group I intron endonuclease